MRIFNISILLQYDLKHLYMTNKFREWRSTTLPLTLSLHSEVELKWSDTLHLFLQSTPSWVGRSDLRAEAGLGSRD